jgi:putative flippase GtrA
MRLHPFFTRHLSQGIKFALVGGLGATFDFIALTILVQLLHVNEHVAFVISASSGAIIVFFINRTFTFRAAAGAYGQQLPRFAAVYGTAIVLNAALASFFFWTGFDYRFSKLLAIAVVAIWNYTLSHSFVFRK